MLLDGRLILALLLLTFSKIAGLSVCCVLAESNLNIYTFLILLPVNITSLCCHQTKVSHKFEYSVAWIRKIFRLYIT